ncbi:MAG: MFS transporter [Tissierellaceae bacterium]|nr:MFS transporter [Tissierellaceae bacterium]
MEKTNKIFYGWWIVVGSILVTATIVPSVMAMANKFLIPVTTDMGINRSTFSIGNAILQAMGIPLAPLITKKLVKGNLKRIQMFSIIIYCIVYATFALARTPIHLYIISFILGIAYLGASMIPISIMITNWFDKKRGLAMSLGLSGVGIGGFIFSPLITSWLENYGWRKTYLIFAVIMLAVSLPVSIFIFSKSPEDKGLKAMGSDEVAKGGKDSSSEFDLTISTKESFTKQFFIMLALGMIFNGLINTGALGQFPPALEELHGSIVAAQVISLYSLVGIFGKLILGWINDKFGIVKGILFGCVTFGLAFFLMLFGSNIFIVYLMAISFGLGNAMGAVMPPLITAEIYGPRKYGEVYGYISSATQLGLTFGSILVASIFDITGSYKPAWIIMILFTIGVIVLWIISIKASFKYRKLQ